MAEERTNSGGDEGSHLLRWLVLTAMVIATIVAGRQWALSRTDQEFERRLVEADRQRN